MSENSAFPNLFIAVGAGVNIHTFIVVRLGVQPQVYLFSSVEKRLMRGFLLLVLVRIGRRGSFC